MPELPELDVYRERLEATLAGRRVSRVTLHDAFALRTVEPPLAAIEDKTLTGVRRRGKHLLLDFDGGPTVAFHLMLAGRLHLKEPETFRPHRRRTRLSLAFESGPVVEMTEAGTKRRASVRVLDAGAPLPERIGRGTEPFDPALDRGRFASLLTRSSRQVKNALRDPGLLAGIGNAYSDEILHAARLSPMKLTSRLTAEELARLFVAMRETLEMWTERIRDACPDGLPVKQDRWRRRMAVHGRTGYACPECGETVAVVSFAESETNYCPGCQTGGRLLADRRLSRLGIHRPPKRIED